MIVGSNILAGASGQGGYFLQRSVRLRSSASAFFNRTPASTGNRTTWTWSSWVKLGVLSSDRFLFNNSNDGIRLYPGTDTLWTQLFAGTAYNLITTQVFRDPSAWYHIVWQVDTTQATASNRVRLYVNGLQITAFSTATYPPQNFNTEINRNTAHYIGSLATNAGYYFDGYLTEINFIDGQSLTPTSFGEFNTLTGVWQPKKYGGTYGTNGFYLNFNDNSAATAAAIGKDSSGNGNNWTPNNISVTAGATYDSMTDVPTLTSATTSNYATLNPLRLGSVITASAGNLQYAASSGNSFCSSTIGVTSGKWYCEIFMTSAGSAALIGIVNENATTASYPGGNANGYGYYVDGNKYTNGAGSAYGSSYTNNDIIGIALDLNTGRVWFSKNGTWQASGDPAAGTNAAFTGISLTNTWFFACGNSGVTTQNINFGQRPFSYTPPTGFLALNTYNLPTPTIDNGSAYMAASLYTGNGTSQSINNTVNGVSFQPDLVWIKSRSSASWSNFLQDQVRGITNFIISNSTNTEATTSPVIVNAVNANGFTVLANGNSNNNGDTYVGWQWKASNASAVTNTSGTISSQVSANTTAGFSIVTYTGTGTNGATFGHGLGVAPAFGIWKVRSGTIGNWVIYHKSLGATQGLNFTTGTATTSAVFFNNTAPTSTVWSLGTVTDVNRSTSTYVNYAFSEIAGYSRFGSYVGNGSADGVFVFLGFRARWILIKSSSLAGTGWYVYDTSRNTYNVMDLYLRPDDTGAQASFVTLDSLSNGFKLRTNNTQFNGSGSTYIYAAFAENPFKIALAR